jgi:O-acetyl-ADP-ribose deacetylase (regulator of RNase III)
MHIKLYYRDIELGNAWKKYFNEEINVELVCGSILDCNTNAIVSPANSFGFMDGGLDYHLSERFGWDLETKLQNMIKNRPLGELLIGEAVVLSTNDQMVPYLISAPTMRVPMKFNIATSVNAYLAMKAILATAKKHDVINSVAIPGLCTGIGKMPYDIAALQMYEAYREIILNEKRIFNDFGDAQKFQLFLNPNSMIYD